MIPGGYYLKARKAKTSWIAHTSPCVREIWDWLISEANHADTEVCKRGQLIRSYKDIQEGLSWQVGYRKMRYSKHQCESATKALTKEQMITTMKTTRGLLITICNYDTYQVPANYENHTESHNDATRTPQCADTINKNDKNVKNGKKKRETRRFIPPSPQEVEDYGETIGFKIDGETFVNNYKAKGWLIGKSPMRDWRAAVVTWKKRREAESRPSEIESQPTPQPALDLMDKTYGPEKEVPHG